MATKFLQGFFVFLLLSLASTFQLSAQQEVVYFIDSTTDEAASYVDNGDKGLKAYILKNLKTKEELKGSELLLLFTVTENGLVKNPRVVQGGTPKTNAEILKLLESAQFNPAMQNGINIESEVLIPLSFTGLKEVQLESNLGTSSK